MSYSNLMIKRKDLLAQAADADEETAKQLIIEADKLLREASEMQNVAQDEYILGAYI